MKAKKLYIVLFFLMIVAVVSNAQNVQNAPGEYNRSSLYSILLVDPSTKMSDEIINAYMSAPVPDKYNNHNLSLRYLTLSRSNQKSRKLEEIFSEFSQRNLIAKRMVAKWFNRDLETGGFDLSLIAERGMYNASASDLAMAMKSQRGHAVLTDAGEQLIGNSFLLVHNVTYIDKEEQAQTAKRVFNGISSVFGALFGTNIVSTVADVGAMVSNTIAGFAVNVESMLYQLQWDNETADRFYAQYFYGKDEVDLSKKTAFEEEKGLFKLVYVGSYTARSDKTVMRGLNEPEEVFRKVIARAIDKNIVALQKKFEMFKVVVPIYQVQGDQVLVQIGLKEGVSASSRYEVIERTEDENGKISYRRKGVIKPNPKMIWDDRYMAVEEEADNAGLSYTTFDIVSGSGFYPGMMVREIKYNSGN